MACGWSLYRSCFGWVSQLSSRIKKSQTEVKIPIQRSRSFSIDVVTARKSQVRALQTSDFPVQVLDWPSMLFMDCLKWIKRKRLTIAQSQLYRRVFEDIAIHLTIFALQSTHLSDASMSAYNQKTPFTLFQQHKQKCHLCSQKQFHNQRHRMKMK